MANPLKQEYKNGGKGNEGGWNITLGRDAQKKSEILEHHSRVMRSSSDTQRGISAI